ncbi:hypothetical protein HDU98_007131 [Podochytrium sp. JEL0797]|nr:hypothetical protein HDU98_007131 [Podochytrium sp. JEL0797]
MFMQNWLNNEISNKPKANPAAAVSTSAEESTTEDGTPPSLNSGPPPSLQSTTVYGPSSSVLEAKRDTRKGDYNTNGFQVFKNINANMKAAMDQAALDPTVPRNRLLMRATTILKDQWTELKINDAEEYKEFMAQAAAKNRSPEIQTNFKSPKEKQKMEDIILAKIKKLIGHLHALGNSCSFHNINQTTKVHRHVVVGAPALMVEKHLQVENKDVEELFEVMNSSYKHTPFLIKGLHLSRDVVLDELKLNLRYKVNMALSQLGKQSILDIPWKSLKDGKFGKDAFTLEESPTAFDSDSESNHIDEDEFTIREDETGGVDWYIDGGPSGVGRQRGETENFVPESFARQLFFGWMEANNALHGKYGNDGVVQWKGDSQTDLEIIKNHMLLGDDGCWDSWAAKLCKAKEAAGEELDENERELFEQ